MQVTWQSNKDIGLSNDRMWARGLCGSTGQIYAIENNKCQRGKRIIAFYNTACTSLTT
jgi:hypothetical protein